MPELELYIPKREDLWFRRELLSDPDTMGYNKGYDLGFPEYHNDTGCIDFPEENWDGWYARWVHAEPERSKPTGRFYAYLRRKEDGAFLGQVSLHPVEEAGWFEMEIVLHSRYRGQGYSAQGMELLLWQAFKKLCLPVVCNRFERTRKAAWKLHEAAGFEAMGEKSGIVTIVLTRERYLRQTRTALP